MNQVFQYLDMAVARLGLDGCDKIEFLQQPCKVLKVPRPAYLVLAVLFVAVFMIVIGLASSFLSSVLGILYPAYQSIKAIESQVTDDDKQWLTYWIVFSLATVMDNTCGCVLEYVPFFHLIKLVFFVSLFHPKYRGAEYVYNMVIKPMFDKYHGAIDSKLSEFEQRAKEKLEQAKKQY